MLRKHRHDCLTVVLLKNRERKTVVFLTALQGILHVLHLFIR